MGKIYKLQQMGGEHHVCFHDGVRAPCYYIHNSSDNKDIEESEQDMMIWKKVKKIIIDFLDEISWSNSRKQISEYVNMIMKFERPSDISLYWSHRDDDNIVGYMMHDITKLLTVAFPGKICACFDRCIIYNESPDLEWGMCTIPYGRYDEIPKFKLYKIGKVKETDLMKVIIGDF